MVGGPTEGVYQSRSDRANRGPRKQVFVCGVTKRSGPVRQDIIFTRENMKATAGEFRFRGLIFGAIYLIGFSAPWDYALRWNSGADSIRTWQWVAAWGARSGWIGFSAATLSVLVVGIVCMLVAALLRTWASAYMGRSIVQARAMHGERVVAAGPYRFTRNPLYLGIFVHTLALALLMPPTGAAFCIVAIGLFELRLIAGEESFLSATLEDAYRAYCAKVPRIGPSLRPRLPASPAEPDWLSALAGEIYFWGAFVSFATLGWRYNASLIVQGVLVSFGVAMIVRALLPRATPLKD